jgi:hypothetical protein
MNCLRSTIDAQAAIDALDRLERQAHQELGIRIPSFDRSAADDRDRYERYLASNPDITPDKLVEALAQFEQRRALRANVVDLSSSPSILNGCVGDLESAIGLFDKEQRLSRTYFGTVPGGGLDASSFRLTDGGAYAVVIPQGFFHLTNLLTKLVILLHPFTPTPKGFVFMPTASFEQLGLAAHPYIKFRHQDLLEAFFLIGDPMAALPYTEAIPYQDRFAYLLAGTELFVVAHEVAHVLLGHIDDPADGNALEERELAADELALRIVTTYFRAHTDFPVARASLCGSLFLSMVRLWEAGIARLTGDPEIARSHTHPAFASRLQRFTNALSAGQDEQTPNWYLFTHNAIRFATEMMATPALDVLAEKAQVSAGLSARVLPRAHQHLGHFNGWGEERYWLKVADLLTSAEVSHQRLGLWFLVRMSPSSALGLYLGLLSEDEAAQAKCQRALIAIEPLYANYIPRLRERYRQTEQDDGFDQYVLNLSTYLSGKAAHMLEKFVGTSGPMSPDFFKLAKTP